MLKHLGEKARTDLWPVAQFKELQETLEAAVLRSRIIGPGWQAIQCKGRKSARRVRLRL